MANNLICFVILTVLGVKVSGRQILNTYQYEWVRDLSNEDNVREYLEDRKSATRMAREIITSQKIDTKPGPLVMGNETNEYFLSDLLHLMATTISEEKDVVLEVFSSYTLSRAKEEIRYEIYKGKYLHIRVRPAVAKGGLVEIRADTLKDVNFHGNMKFVLAWSYDDVDYSVDKEYTDKALSDMKEVVKFTDFLLRYNVIVEVDLILASNTLNLRRRLMCHQLLIRGDYSFEEADKYINYYFISILISDFGISSTYLDVRDKKIRKKILKGMETAKADRLSNHLLIFFTLPLLAKIPQ